MGGFSLILARFRRALSILLAGEETKASDKADEIERSETEFDRLATAKWAAIGRQRGSEPTSVSEARVIGEIRTEIERLFKKDANRRSGSSRLIKAGLILGGTVIAGIAQSLPSSPATTFSDFIRSPSFWQIFGVIIAFIGGVWSLVAEPHAPAALYEARKAIEMAQTIATEQAYAEDRNKFQIDEWKRDYHVLKRHCDWLASYVTVTLVVRELIENILAKGEAIDAADYQRLISSLAPKLLGLMQLDPGEYWTISLYQQNADEDGVSDGKLGCVATERADRSTNHNKKRRWGAGEGVVGHVFMTGREIIVDDAGDPDRAGWIHVPTPKDGDNENYRSILGIPVKAANLAKSVEGNNSPPWGVLIASSNREGRFAAEDEFANKAAEPMRMLAGFFALIAARR